MKKETIESRIKKLTVKKFKEDGYEYRELSNDVMVRRKIPTGVWKRTTWSKKLDKYIEYTGYLKLYLEDCKHKWVMYKQTSPGFHTNHNFYECKLCGKKEEDYNNPVEYFTIKGKEIKKVAERDYEVKPYEDEEEDDY